MEEKLQARGHPLIAATHATTLEITRDPDLTPRGDCIVGVSASKGCADLDGRLRKAIREGAEVYLILEVQGAYEEIRGTGHPGLSLSHPREMVVRTSEYLSPRTLFIGADRASADLSRGFVERLRSPDASLTIAVGEV